jgi:outer membrane protein assembly factor BamA
MRLSRRALPVLLLLTSLAATAQTYTPKTIRIDAPPSVDAPEALRVAALPISAPLTKQQIETALQRLADTGLFSDVGYTVDSAALIIKLTPSATGQLLPARFANFVWWQPAELESLLEAKVPAYHGKLPVAGNLTDHVRAALVSLLYDKGIDATVDSMEATDQPGGPIVATTLTITNPPILVGDLHLQNALPTLQPQLTKFQQRLHGQDFDIATTTKTVQASVNDIYMNAGYLAVDTTAPTYSAPHKDMLSYAVDLTSTITPGDIYHVTNLTIHAQPPVSQPDLETAANIHPGDPASPAAQRLARAEMQKAYADQGFLDAKVLFTLHADNQAHTVTYVANIDPGPVYHYASIDASALPYDQQAAFTRLFTVAPGALADARLNNAIQTALQSLHLGYPVSLSYAPDRATHTVKIALTTAASSSVH